MSLTQDGQVGVGVPAPGFRLDVGDRMRVRQGPSGSAGIWFLQTTPNADKGFVGMVNDNQIGFWGNNGAGWGLFMDATNGDVFIRGQLHAGGKGGYVMDQFINNIGEDLEQGDVVVIGDAQPSLHYGVNDTIPVPEVDLTSEAYDKRVCGIVWEAHGQPKPAEDGQIPSDDKDEKVSKKADAGSVCALQG
jgi:hypothetical protein